VDETLTPRQKTLLLFLAAGAKELDPVRIQKGLFIFAKETPSHWVSPEARHEFRPYNYGPYSSQINADLAELRRRGLVKTSESWSSWHFYSATDEGREVAGEIATKVRAAMMEYLKALREWVTSLSFSDLLKQVYKSYPDFAKNSVFQY
jgi:uncharacterized protein YwgA